MISQTAEYALRAVVCLGRYKDTALTTTQIAKATRMPPGYLSKVLQALGRAGIVHSQRGLHGGFSLSRAVEALTVLDIINAVDPFRRFHGCPLGIESHDPSLCPLHRRIDEALATIEKAFSEVTVRNLLDDEGRRKVLCGAASPVRA